MAFIFVNQVQYITKQMEIYFQEVLVLVAVAICFSPLWKPPIKTVGSKVRGGDELNFWSAQHIKTIELKENLVLVSEKLTQIQDRLEEKGNLQKAIQKRENEFEDRIKFIEQENRQLREERQSLRRQLGQIDLKKTFQAERHQPKNEERINQALLRLQQINLETNQKQKLLLQRLQQRQVDQRENLKNELQLISRKYEEIKINQQSLLLKLQASSKDKKQLEQRVNNTKQLANKLKEKYQGQLNSLKDKHNRKQTQFDGLKRQLSIAYDDLARLKKEKESDAAIMAKQSSAETKLNIDKSKLKRELEDLKSGNQKQVKTLKESFQTLKSQKQALEWKQKQQTQKIASLEKKLSERSGQATEDKKLAVQVEKLKNQLKQKDQEIAIEKASLHKIMRDSESERESLKSNYQIALMQKESELKRLTQSSVQKQVKKNNEQQRFADDYVHQIQAENKNVDIEKDQALLESKRQGQVILQLNNLITQQVQKLNLMEQNLENKEKIIKNFEQQISSLTESLRKKQLQVYLSNQRNGKSELQIAQRMQQILNLKSQLYSFSPQYPISHLSEKSHVKGQGQQALTNCDSNRYQVEQIRAKELQIIESLKQKCASMQQQNGDLIRENDLLKKLKNQLDQKHSQMEREISRYIQEIENLGVYINNLQTRIKQLENTKKEIQQLKNLNMDLQRRLQQGQQRKQSFSLSLKRLTLFNGQILQHEEMKKNFLIKSIEDHVKKQIQKTYLIYETKKDYKVSFHERVDGKSNLILVLQTENALMAGYYSGKYAEATFMTEEALIISLTNLKSYRLNNFANNPRKNKKDTKPVYGMVYDKFFLIFGNSEIRVKPGDKDRKVFSNFGVSNSYFNSEGDNVGKLLCQGKTTEAQIVAYQIYEASFVKLNQ